MFKLQQQATWQLYSHLRGCGGLINADKSYLLFNWNHFYSPHSLAHSCGKKQGKHAGDLFALSNFVLCYGFSNIHSSQTVAN